MRTLIWLALTLGSPAALADDAASPVSASSPSPLEGHQPASIAVLLDTGREPVERRRSRRRKAELLSEGLGDPSVPANVKADLHLELGHLQRDEAAFGPDRHRADALEAAIDQFALAIHAAPSSAAAVEARMARAALSRELQRTDAMLDDLATVLYQPNAGPWAPVARLMLGEHYLSTGQLAAAHRMLASAGTIEGPVDAYASWLDAVVQRTLGYHHSATLSAMRAAALAPQRTWDPSRDVSELARIEAVRNAAYLEDFDNALEVIDVVCIGRGMGCVSRLRWHLADHYDRLGRDDDAATASGLSR